MWKSSQAPCQQQTSGATRIDQGLKTYQPCKFSNEAAGVMVRAERMKPRPR